MICELASFGGCQGPLQHHHIVNKSKLRKVPEAKKFCEDEHPEIFIAHVCAGHNVSRFADSKQAQAFLLSLRVRDFGYEYVYGVFQELLSYFKAPPWDSLDSILE